MGDGDGHCTNYRQAFREAEARFDDLSGENDELRRQNEEAQELFTALADLIRDFMEKQEASTHANH